TCFGLVRWLPAALVLLAVAGWADVISAVYRSTILQLNVPDALRGRLMGVQMAVVTGGPRIGDVESGAVAAALSPVTSVVSGGLAALLRSCGDLGIGVPPPPPRGQRSPPRYPSSTHGLASSPADSPVSA